MPSDDCCHDSMSTLPWKLTATNSHGVDITSEKNAIRKGKSSKKNIFQVRMYECVCFREGRSSLPENLKAN